jgi:hypothetical protein
MRAGENLAGETCQNDSEMVVVYTFFIVKGVGFVPVHGRHLEAALHFGMNGCPPWTVLQFHSDGLVIVKRMRHVQ